MNKTLVTLISIGAISLSSIIGCVEKQNVREQIEKPLEKEIYCPQNKPYEDSPRNWHKKLRAKYA
jgi:hypothetical protein